MFMKKAHDAPRTTRRDSAHSGRRTGRPDDANAFVPDNNGQLKPLAASDAESFAEELINSATQANSVQEEASDEVVDEESGGPFVLLDDEGKLPSEPAERRPDSEGHDSVERELTLRGAKWAARGA
jgi:hypothetical protein